MGPRDQVQVLMLDLPVPLLQDYLLEVPFLTCAFQNENQAKPTLSENQTFSWMPDAWRVCPAHQKFLNLLLVS